MEHQEKKIKLENVDLLSLLGHKDVYLQLIENKFNSVITVRGNTLILKGSPSELKIIEAIFNELLFLLQKRGSINSNDVESIIDIFYKGKPYFKSDYQNGNENIIFSGAREIIKARNPRQIEYHHKVLNNDLVFTIGPAGTGKTFLAVAMACAALKRNEVSRIILSRPAVEAGESLGFLPGDLLEKLDPYLRPLTDALFYMLNADKLKNMMDKNIIEIIPLAYMRGRTLNNSFIILDEAQNTTITQMKMFLTRLGGNSKAIITGDITQIDLSDKADSGLVHTQKILQNINGIEFVYFEKKDIVRHRLVAEIINAYENDLKRQNSSNGDE